MICSRCYRANDEETTKCVNCGYDMLAPDTSMVNTKSWTKQDLMEVANRQKNIIWMVLISLLASFIPYATIVTGIILIYFIYKLAVAVRHEAAWIFIILMFIPFVCLIALARINGAATRILRAEGVNVGLMGAKMADFDNIQ